LKWHEEVILNWKRNRRYLEEKRERERQRNSKSFDRSEFDSANEIWFYWEGKLAAYELLLDLYVSVSCNPFPGEKLRLLEVAYSLFPQVEGGFSPGERLRGRAYWRATLREFGICGNQKIYFPEKVDEVDLVEIERKLLELAGKESFVPVDKAREVLVWYPRSKTYVTVRKNLESNGWKWGQRRIEGKLNRVIYSPK
jgi:hypothetical protein